MRLEEIETARLRLRLWTEGDLGAFAELNADPEVMRFFPAPLDAEQSRRLLKRIQSHFEEHGYGLWAAERRADGTPLGFVGLQWATFESDFTPALEIGWRLRREVWGRGLATEAAREVLRVAFEQLAVERVVSFTAAINERSRKVMERIGLRFVREFEHPSLPPGHGLRRHVLYESLGPAVRG